LILNIEIKEHRTPHEGQKTKHEIGDYHWTQIRFVDGFAGRYRSDGNRGIHSGLDLNAAGQPAGTAVKAVTL